MNSHISNTVNFTDYVCDEYCRFICPVEFAERFIGFLVDKDVKAWVPTEPTLHSRSQPGFVDIIVMGDQDTHGLDLEDEFNHLIELELEEVS